MGINKWQTSDTWPPAGASAHDVLPVERRQGQHAGRRRRARRSTPPAADTPDAFTYDPMNPVTSYGGNVCCTGNAITAGSFDQRKMEARPDILVYTSEPFKEGIEVSGPDHADALRLVRREGHRLHGQGARRLSRRPRLQPRRVHPADALPRRLRQAARLDGEGQGLQGHAAAADHQQLLRGRATGCASRCRAATSRASTAT